MVFENIRNLHEDNDKLLTELAEYLHVKQTTYCLLYTSDMAVSVLQK